MYLEAGFIYIAAVFIEHSAPLGQGLLALEPRNMEDWKGESNQWEVSCPNNNETSTCGYSDMQPLFYALHT